MEALRAATPMNEIIFLSPQQTQLCLVGLLANICNDKVACVG